MWHHFWYWRQCIFQQQPIFWFSRASWPADCSIVFNSVLRHKLFCRLKLVLLPGLLPALFPRFSLVNELTFSLVSICNESINVLSAAFHHVWYYLTPLLTTEAACFSTPTSSLILQPQLGVLQVNSILRLTSLVKDWVLQEYLHFRQRPQMGCPGCLHFCPANYKFGDAHDPLLNFNNLLEQLTTLGKML